MTIATKQLDELETRAKAVQDAIAMSRPLRCVFDEYVEANSPDVTLRLVAVYRAALALDAAWTDHNPGAYGLFDARCQALRDALRGAP